MRIAWLAVGSVTVFLACACSASAPTQDTQSVLGMGTAAAAGQTAGAPTTAAASAGSGALGAKTTAAASGAAAPGIMTTATAAAGQGGTTAASAPGATGDTDADGIPDAMDNCPMVANADQKDSDADTHGDACDNCKGLPNPDQTDANADGEGDACSCDMPAVPCTNGMSGPYPCSGVDMLGRIPLADMGARSGASIWGATESVNHREIGLVAVDVGTAFVDLSKPRCPAIIGMMPASGARSQWREVRAYGDIVVDVSEAQNHGMQIFDLKKLPATGGMDTMLKEHVLYKGSGMDTIGSAHSVFAHGETNMVYIVGARNTCDGGLHMVDMKDPMNPKFAGCGTTGHYVHDVSCFVYHGPDEEHAGAEICITFNGETVDFSVVDVTNKMAPKELSRVKYDGGVYSHEGWLTKDHKTLLLADEEDEERSGAATRTYLFDMTDLDQPKALTPYTWSSKCTDHNIYIMGDRGYYAAYTEGLRILDVTMAGAAMVKEVGFFDSNPKDNSNQMNGAWGVFPYFASGNVLIGDMVSGMFVVKPQATVLATPQ